MTQRMGTPPTGGVFRTLRYMPSSKVVISIRLSPETVEAVDAARGSVSRTRWVETVVSEAVAPMDETETIRGTVPTPGAATKDHTARCDHPRARVIKGFCYRCGSMVLK